MEELINYFRIWCNDWELYSKGLKQHKPKSIEYFIEELKEYYEVTKIT